MSLVIDIRVEGRNLRSLEEAEELRRLRCCCCFVAKGSVASEFSDEIRTCHFFYGEGKDGIRT